jgi:hypothetical protein
MDAVYFLERLRYMLLHLIAAGSNFPKPSYGSWVIFALLTSGLIWDLFKRGSKQGWLLRPSNILILLGVIFYLYRTLYDPQWDSRRSSASIGVTIIALAFAVRKWDSQAIKDMNESELGEDDTKEEET